MVNWKLKYLKYKIKYTKLSNNQKGGTIVLKVTKANRPALNTDDNLEKYYPHASTVNNVLQYDLSSKPPELFQGTLEEEYGNFDFNFDFFIGKNHEGADWNPGEVKWYKEFVASYNFIHKKILIKLRDLKTDIVQATTENRPDHLKEYFYNEIIQFCPVDKFVQLNLDRDPIYCQFSPWGIKLHGTKVRGRGNYENYLEPLTLRVGKSEKNNAVPGYRSIDTLSFFDNQYIPFIEDLKFIRNNLFDLKIYQYNGEEIVLRTENYDFNLKKGDILHYNYDDEKLILDDETFEISKHLFIKIPNKCEFFINNLCNDIKRTLIYLRNSLLRFQDENDKRKSGSQDAQNHGKKINNIINSILNKELKLSDINYQNAAQSNKYKSLIDELKKYKQDKTKIEDVSASDINSNKKNLIDIIKKNMDTYSRLFEELMTKIYYQPLKDSMIDQSDKLNAKYASFALVQMDLESELLKFIKILERAQTSLKKIEEQLEKEPKLKDKIQMIWDKYSKLWKKLKPKIKKGFLLESSLNQFNELEDNYKDIMLLQGDVTILESFIKTLELAQTSLEGLEESEKKPDFVSNDTDYAGNTAKEKKTMTSTEIKKMKKLITKKIKAGDELTEDEENFCIEHNLGGGIKN